MNLDNKRYCLVLSSSFTPLNVIGVKKAMKYLINEQGKALDPYSYEMFDFEKWLQVKNDKDYASTVRSEKLWVSIPEIIVLKKDHVQTKLKNKAIVRKKVYDRDENRCRYCNCSLNTKNRTIDHVQPISKGGDRFSYTNVVACCFDCNSTKSDKLLSELRLNGPDKKNDRGEVIMSKQERWDVKGNILNPSESILYHVPRKHVLGSWKPFVKELC